MAKGYLNITIIRFEINSLIVDVGNQVPNRFSRSKEV
jgi:hypothetical protein